VPTHSFAEAAGKFLCLSTPIGGQYTLGHIAVEAAVRPISGARYVPVLDWIVVNVIDMPLQVGIIANGVLPITPLPDTFLALGNLACGALGRRRQAA
jgi:hypothetical protein